VSGDEFVLSGAFPIPTVLKLDIEGAEKVALEGLSETLRRDECRLVYVEVHPKGGFSAPGYGSVGLTDTEIDAVRGMLTDAGFGLRTVHCRDGQPFLKASKPSR